MVLVHGAGSGPWVYDRWRPSFEGSTFVTPDLHAGLAVERASMGDYTRNVAAGAESLPRPLALIGWSMGGLVAMISTAEIRPDVLVLLEPSPPAESQGVHPEVRPVDGAYDPEDLYGTFPTDQRSRPESVRARMERQRGISVPAITCPSLVVYGNEYREERGEAIARLYGSDALHLEGLSHWNLVLDLRVPKLVREWVRRHVPTFGDAESAPRG